MKYSIIVQSFNQLGKGMIYIMAEKRKDNKGRNLQKGRSEKKWKILFSVQRYIRKKQSCIQLGIDRVKRKGKTNKKGP